MKKGIVVAALLAVASSTYVWQQKQPPTANATPKLPPVAMAPETRPVSISDKLNQIIIPEYPTSGVTLEEVIEFLRLKSRELDTTTPETSRKGVNIVFINNAERQLPASIGLQLKDVPLGEALRHIIGLVGMKYTVEPHAVTIRNDDDMRSPPLKTKNTTVIEQRLQQVIRPTVQFQNATLEEAVEYLRVSPGCFDVVDAQMPPPLNFVIKIRDGMERSPISLDLTDFPLGEALRYVAEISGARLRFDPSAVTITDDAANRPTPSGSATPSQASIILPAVEFSGATLAQAIEFIRIKSREIDPEKTGVSITVKSGGDPHIAIELSLKRIPVVEALHYIAELSNHRLTIEGNVFVLMPAKEP